MTTEIPIALSSSDPLTSAKTFVASHYRLDNGLALRHYDQKFYHYTPDHGYRVVEDASLRSCLYAFLPRFRKADKAEPFTPTSRNISEIVDALKAIVHLPAEPRAPRWIDELPGQHDPLDVIPCANGLLHLPTRTLTPATPQFFAFGALPFDYVVPDQAPTHWLRFLHELWPEDADAQDMLQEWMGYLLTARTHFQKIMLMVGPARSGKGTIGRVIRQLLGVHRVCAPTLSSLAMPFGGAILLDKAAALIADARLSGRSDTAILTERLLSISGEDPQTVPRKFLDDWNGTLPVRFTLMTNELPRIEDSSGALASRFLLLVLKESFLGREDHTLFDRLTPELPAILHWALEGWDRLSARGAFVQPASSQAILQEFKDLGSPIQAFLRQRCVQTGTSEVSKERLYAAWQSWCKATGRDHAGTTQVFSKNLRSALPWLGESRPRVLGRQTEFWNGVDIKDELENDDS